MSTAVQLHVCRTNAVRHYGGEAAGWQGHAKTRGWTPRLPAWRISRGSGASHGGVRSLRVWRSATAEAPRAVPGSRGTTAHNTADGISRSVRRTTWSTLM